MDETLDDPSRAPPRTFAGISRGKRSRSGDEDIPLLTYGDSTARSRGEELDSDPEEYEGNGPMAGGRGGPSMSYRQASNIYKIYNGDGRSRVNKGRSDQKCYKCGWSGHYARDCTKLDRDYFNPVMPSDSFFSRASDPIRPARDSTTVTTITTTAPAYSTSKVDQGAFAARFFRKRQKRRELSDLYRPMKMRIVSRKHAARKIQRAFRSSRRKPYNWPKEFLD